MSKSSFAGKRYFNIAFAVIWLFVIVMSLFINIYADEPAFRIYNSRHGVDGGEIVGNLYGSSCHFAEKTELPKLLLPARLAASSFWASLSGPRDHRIFGVMSYTVLIFIVFLLVMNISKKNKINFETLFFITILPLCLGVNPFNLVSTRPEVFILINLFIFIYIRSLNVNTMLKTLSTAIVILVLASFFFLLHAKALLFFPFVVILLIYILKDSNKYLALLGVVCLSVLCFFSYKLHTGRLVCPENQVALDMMQGINLTTRQLVSDPMGFLKNGIRNLNIFKYFAHVGFIDSYQSSWLVLNVNKYVRFIGFGINIFIYLILFGLCIFSMKVVFDSLRKKKLITLDSALISSFFTGIFAMCFLQVAKYFYETPLFFSLVSAMMLLCLAVTSGFNVTSAFQRSKWTMRILKGSAFMSLVFLGFNSFNTAILNKKELGIGMPTYTDSFPAMNQGFQKIAKSCQLDKDYPSGTVYTDALGFFYAYNQPNLRIINFANALQDMNRVREQNNKLFYTPAISLFLGECRWIETFENKMNILDSFNVKDRKFCCAVPVPI